LRSVTLIANKPRMIAPAKASQRTAAIISGFTSRFCRI
jgi:hypothetical protein